MNRRAWLGGCMAAALAILTGCERENGPAASSVDSLFDQTLPDLAGGMQPLAQWRGKPMVVNFWATWCAPCVKEMPDLEQLSQEFPQIAFIGIGIDSTEKMLEFLNKVPVTYTLLEARAQGLDLMRDLGNANGGLPFSVLIDADQRLLRTISGIIDREDLRQALRPLAVSV